MSLFMGDGTTEIGDPEAYECRPLGAGWYPCAPIIGPPG